MKLKPQLTVIISSLLFAIGGFAYGNAVTAPDSGNVIYGCVTGINGNITRVSSTPKTCPRGSTQISWNKAGEQGPMGLQGPKGDSGSVTGAQVPWYLADSTGTAVAVPIAFNMMPDGPDESVGVMLHGMFATVDLKTGKVWSAPDVGDIQGASFTLPNCQGQAMASTAQKNRYIELSDGSRAFVGDGKSFTIGDSRSATSSADLKNAISYALYNISWFNPGDAELVIPEFVPSSHSSTCLNYTLEDLTNYAASALIANAGGNPATWSEGTQAIYNEKLPILISQFLAVQLDGLTPTALLDDFEPLHIVSSY